MTILSVVNIHCAVVLCIQYNSDFKKNSINHSVKTTLFSLNAKKSVDVWH